MGVNELKMRKALELMLRGTKKDLGRICMPSDAAVAAAFEALAQQPAAVVELTDQEIAESIMGANSWPNNLLPTYLSIQAVRAVIAAHIAKQQEKGHAE